MIDPFPEGWFCVGRPADLEPGCVMPLRLHGRDFVLWRDGNGTPHAMDAYCQHLGAHLGYGGRVEHDTVRCPFHAWRYDATGRCVEIPYATRDLTSMPQLVTYPLLERAELLLVWPGSQAPTWEPTGPLEISDDAWTPITVEHTWSIRTRWREIAENAVDLTHFHYLHGIETVPELTSCEPDGPVWRSESRHQVRTPRGRRKSSFQVELQGPGHGWLRFTIEGTAEVLFLISVVPRERDVLDLSFRFLKRRYDDEYRIAATDALVQEVIDQVTDDVPIWENKIVREPPMLARGDGPIMKLRRWSEQFTAVDPTAELAETGAIS